MITSLYVDNFRCLVNFRLDLEPLTLLMGENGSGKSTIFDVIARLRRFVSDPGCSVGEFPASDICRWDSRDQMRLELRVRLLDPSASAPAETMDLTYELTVEPGRDGRQGRVVNESICEGQTILFLFSDGNVRLLRDDDSPGHSYPFNPSRSALASVAARPEYRRVAAFREFMAELVQLNAEPTRMTAAAPKDAPSLARTGENFAAWYRHLSQEYQDRVLGLHEELRQVLPGLKALNLPSTGRDSRELETIFAREDGQGDVRYRFDELSDGQRELIVLYTLIFGQPAGRHALFVDEPVNYVSLREIQPWLALLSDKCGAEVPQAVLASHHPELINYLGGEHGVWLEREANGPTRAQYGIPDDGTDLELAERVARGWVDG